MVVRILVVAALILGAMVAVKDGRLLRTAGLTSSCTVVQTGTDGAQVEQCRAGKLEGLPDLSRQSCTSLGRDAAGEVWRCPAPVASGPHG